MKYLRVMVTFLNQLTYRSIEGNRHGISLIVNEMLVSTYQKLRNIIVLFSEHANKNLAIN